MIFPNYNKISTQQVSTYQYTQFRRDQKKQTHSVLLLHSSWMEELEEIKSFFFLTGLWKLQAKDHQSCLPMCVLCVRWVVARLPQQHTWSMEYLHVIISQFMPTYSVSLHYTSFHSEDTTLLTQCILKYRGVL